MDVWSTRILTNKAVVIFGVFGSGPPTQIAERLYQSGYPINPMALKMAGFDAIVLAAEELQPENPADYEIFPDGVTVHCAPIDDDYTNGPSIDEIEIVERAVTFVLKQLAAGKTVLVTCAMGRNRSGLINALVLTYLRGIDGRGAAAIVRNARANALTNPSFCAFLDNVPAP